MIQHGQNDYMYYKNNLFRSVVAQHRPGENPMESKKNLRMGKKALHEEKTQSGYTTYMHTFLMTQWIMLIDGDNMKTTDVEALKCVRVIIGERVVHMTSNNTNTNSVCEKFVTAWMVSWNDVID